MPTLGDGRLLAVAKSVNVNTTATDTAITIPNGGKSYVVTGFRTTNPSTSLTGSSGTIGLYTAAAGAGTAIVTKATASITPLTAASKYVNCTIAETTDSLSGSTLYIHNGIAHGSAATIDCYIYGDLLD
jgi:hypothetical protein